MPNKSVLLKQFLKPDEKLLFSKAFDQAFICENRWVDTFTDFLDPLKAESFSNAIRNNFDLTVLAFGGAPGCERCMLGFSHNDEIRDFPIDTLEIIFPKASGLAHRDFLGAILGLGISRDKVGDIFVFERRALAFLERGVSAFISANLKKAGNTTVETSVIIDEFLHAPLGDYVQKDISVSSLRLDNVISAGFGLSRSESLKLVQGDKAQINWGKASNPSKTVGLRDNITLRGFGRLEIKEIHEGKKGNYIIKIHRLG